MNISQLDQTYLLQSYNQNNLFFSQNCTNPLNNGDSGKETNIKIIDGIFQEEMYVKSQEIYGESVMKVLSKKQGMPSPSIFQVENQGPYNQIGDQYGKNEFIDSLPQPRNMKKVQNFIQEVLSKYKSALWEIEQKNDLIHQLTEILRTQSNFIDNHLKQFIHFERKWSENQKSLAKILDTNKLRECLEDTQRYLSKAQDSKNKDSFSKINVNQLMLLCVKKVNDFIKVNSQKILKIKTQKQSPEIQEKNKNFSPIPINKFQYKESQKKSIVKPHIKTQAQRMTKQQSTTKNLRTPHIRVQTQKYSQNDDENNPYLINQLVNGVGKSHDRFNKLDKLDQQQGQWHIKTNKRNQMQTQGGNSHLQETSKLSHYNNNYDNFSKIQVFEDWSVLGPDRVEDSRIQNYRLLTNFRIKQLQKQNQFLKYQINGFRGKNIILRGENSEFKQIIQGLIQQIKNQCKDNGQISMKFKLFM